MTIARVEKSGTCKMFTRVRVLCSELWRNKYFELFCYFCTAFMRKLLIQRSDAHVIVLAGVFQGKKLILCSSSPSQINRDT